LDVVGDVGGGVSCAPSTVCRTRANPSPTPRGGGQERRAMPPARATGEEPLEGQRDARQPLLREGLQAAPLHRSSRPLGDLLGPAVDGPSSPANGHTAGHERGPPPPVASDTRRSPPRVGRGGGPVTRLVRFWDFVGNTHAPMHSGMSTRTHLDARTSVSDLVRLSKHSFKTDVKKKRGKPLKIIARRHGTALPTRPS